jgi:hypothetical protein
MRFGVPVGAILLFTIAARVESQTATPAELPTTWEAPRAPSSQSWLSSAFRPAYTAPD